MKLNMNSLKKVPSVKEPEQKNQPSPAVLNSNDPYSIIQQKIRKDSSDQYLISQDPFKTNNNNSSTNNTNGNINYGPNPQANLHHINSVNSKNKGQSQNAPRDQEHNNIRVMYPKLEEDGFTYTGEWKNGKRDGFGVLSLKDISKYIGEFNDNIVYGFGMLLHSNGDKIIGYWDDFKSNGLGFYISPNKCFSKGYWENNKLHGYGIENYVKAQYEGDYVYRCKQGIGELFFDEIGCYRGEFDDYLMGVGTFLFKDGRKYEGQWRNNKMNGYGIITLPKGNWFEGEFVDDKREGFGVFYSAKKMYIGIWRNSKLDGETIIIENGVIKKSVWENGKLVRNLSNEHRMIYEKYVTEILQTAKSKMNIK